MIETILFWAAMWPLSGLVVWAAGTLLSSGEITVEDLQYVGMSIALGPLLLLALAIAAVSINVSDWWRRNRNKTIISFKRHK